MKTKILNLGRFIALGLTVLVPSCACAQGPIIPPSVSHITPPGMPRGKTAAFELEGRNLSEATDIFFDAAGMSGKITKITDVTEEITGPRAGEDLEAQVPRGKKQTAKLEVTIANDVLPGIHRFRIKTPLGTTNMMAIAVGMLPEVKARESAMSGSEAPPQMVDLPATLTGTIRASGAKDSYQFEGKAGDEFVFSVEASKLDSKLSSALVLSDSSGQVLATVGRNDPSVDAVLRYKLTQGGKYIVTIADRNNGGGMDYFYRMDAGILPYVVSYFPLGVRAGEASEVSVSGMNLGKNPTIKIDSPKYSEGWATIPLRVDSGGLRQINSVKLAVGNEPETLEREPNNTIGEAQSISFPVTINGHIDGGKKAGAKADEDYFRFHASKGEQLSIDVAASRLGSQLDSVIEVLDVHGNAIPRATIRCLNQTTTALSDKDSRTVGIRLNSTSGLREGDYLMVGDELNQIQFIPDQPDADSVLTGIDDLRLAYLGTSPDVHPVNTPVYKSQILPADAEFPSNGLPVFHLTWRNDDGGPGYGADSKLDFVAPGDGDYFIHLKDVRGMEGADFAYRLTVRQAGPDYRLQAEPANPNIPKGGSTTLTVSIIAMQGETGPIDVEVKGLPKGVSATSATIYPGQISTVVVLSAKEDVSIDTHPSLIEVIGHSNFNGHSLRRVANSDGESNQPLQLASIIPAADVIVTTDSQIVSIEPGKEVTVTLHIDRRNGFKGRVPCFVQNLPPGVRVVNVGLNGVLVTEAQTSRTFTLRAEDWAKPLSQPIYVVAVVESNSATNHPSAPLLLHVAERSETTSANLAENQ